MFKFEEYHIIIECIFYFIFLQLYNYTGEGHDPF